MSATDVVIDIDPVAVTAFFFALVRTSAWLLVSPPFNTRLVPVTVKAGIAAALAVAAVPEVRSSDLDLSTAGFLGAAVLQVVVGVALGLITLLLFGAVQAAGGLIDLFAGFSLASIVDPTSGVNSSVFGRFYQVVAITLLFATNAHLLLVDGFLRSFEVVPVSGFEASSFAELLLEDVGGFFVAAVEIAGPVLACLFLAELTMGLLARAAPSLNVFALAFPLRVGVTLVVTGIALPLVAPAVHNLVRDAARLG